ncbi:hypothetical protein ACKWTF_012787 [Chironomus riparius]
MFSIENYIKELIISKVEKFVRNINPEELKSQFKVSLWEGDMVFQNLELKLDVLDEELQIPFTFISGFIKYLKIQIPWTKIGNEPITLTINDSELVVKLKDLSNYSPPMPKPKNKGNSLEGDESSSGYIASLIAKIVNNISVICNNISIKFLEDDIVFSMNIPHLSVYSADSKWRRAFTDVSSASNVIFRKLINIIDLTICLDKRNSLGKIEYVQEPFLYKCSMELRIFRKANSINPEKSSMMRIDVQTKSLNLNVSSQQLAMLVRLTELFVALKSGKLFDQNKVQATSSATNENADENDESWALWMWNNMVPTLMSNEAQSEDIEANSKKIFEFGMYIENAQIALKSQELVYDPIIPSAKKAILKPLLEINVREMFVITIICGSRYFNVKGGISNFDVKALDHCPCSSKTTEIYIMKANKELNGSYLVDSYFDKTLTAQNKYKEMFNNYFEKNHEESMLSKVCISFDILHSVEIPDDRCSSDIGSDLEYSNFSENYIIRVFGDKINFYVTADAIHRIEKIIQYYNECDFATYVKEEKIPNKNQLSPATADDYEALINETPIRNIIMKMKNSELHVKEWDHEKVQRNSRKLGRQHSFNENSNRSCTEFVIKLGDFTLKIESPLYRNRLVYTACQLPDNIENELFQKCFTIIKTNVKNIVIDMMESNAKKICEILKFSSTFKSLIYPSLWEEYDIKQNSFDMELNGLTFMMNPVQFLVFYKTIISNVQRNPTNSEASCSLIENINNPELIVLQLTSRILRFKMSKLSKVSLFEFTISDMIGLAWKKGSKSIVVNIPDSKNKMPSFSTREKEPKSDAILHVYLQIPNSEVADQDSLTIFVLETSEGSINLDPLMREFLSFKIKPDHVKEKEFKRTLSSSTKPLLTELSNIQQSSAHSSSEYQDTLCPSVQTTKVDKNLSNSFKEFRKYIINAHIRPISVYYSTTILESFKASDSIRGNIQSSGCNAIVFKTPVLTFHSVKNKMLTKFVSEHFPVNLPSILWGNDKSLTWNFELSNLSVFIVSDRKMFQIIQNAAMKVSVADESQLEDTELYSGNVLIEIFPILITFHTSKIEFISSAMKEISNFAIFGSNGNFDDKTQDCINYVEESTPSALDIKDFLGLQTGSTITKTSLPDCTVKKSKTNINFYIQSICSKVCLTLIADDVKVPKKFVFEIDETLFSMHQQEFFQLKCKITSISGNHFHQIEGTNEWIKNLNLGFNIQSEQNISDTVSRFLDVTLTKAETINVHSKWNVELKKNSQLILSNVSEINVILQSFDFIISDEVNDFLRLMQMLQGKPQKKQKTFMQYAGSDLPLFHLNCNGFRIFLPNLVKESNPNVLILKVHNIQLSPNAVNNLIRSQIIRPDIVNKASNLGILDLVGSKIEDRQYQLLIKGCSLNSSNWNDITDIICEKNVENYDNPATIWNNFENGPSFPNFKCNTIFKDSSFSFIYAPCIKFKEVVVAGAAIEINCIENMNIITSLDQVILFVDLGEKFKEIGNSFSKADKESEELKNPIKPEIVKVRKNKRFMEKKSNDDSGVASTMSNSYLHKSRRVLHRKVSTITNENSDFVPFEFTFTSSKFNFNFSINNISYYFLLDTPNLYITQNGNDKTFNVSLHDLKIDNEATSLLFTRHGNVDPISGIANSLLRIKVMEKSLRNSELSFEVGRSICIKIKPEIISEILNLMEKLKGNGSKVKNVPKNIRIHSKVRKFDSIKLLMNNFKIINLKTDQIVFDISSDDTFQVTFGVQNIKGRLKLFDRPEKLESNFEINHVTAKCGNNVFIHPLSIESKLKITQEYWKKDPLVYLNVIFNYVKFDVWPNLIDRLVAFGDTLGKVMNVNKNDKMNDNKETSIDFTEVSFEKIQLHPEIYKINDSEAVEHFSDDLRSGIYTFVEVVTPFQELPLPYQIHYQETGIICWRYPLPRALHKIKIFPAPLQTSNQIRIDCKIEFYSQLKSQFEELISLSLNENETKILDIQQNVMFAEVWRIKFKVNIKKDSDDEEDYDGEIESELNYLQMHPKVLLACLRIDSYYKSSAVPTINSLVKVSKVEVNLLHQDTNENTFQRYETVQVCAESIQVLGQHYDENFDNYVIEGALSTDVKDFGCKNVVPFIKKFYLKASLDRNQSDINLNLITSKIKVSYSPAIGHSLLSNFCLWKNQSSISEYVKYTIYNNTANAIKVNQFGVDEIICVLPKSSKFYHFFTDKIIQTLQIAACIQNETWSEQTEAINVHHEGTQYIKCADQYFIITIKAISNYQRKIIIDGQIYVRNMTKEQFVIQYKRYDKDIDNTDKCEIQEVELDDHGSRSFFGACEYDSQQTMKLHLRKCDKRIFSGEIPLREIVANNKPWLVKVPVNSNNKFICYWVRIIRQLVQNELCRVLILICPAFIARSLFPCDIILTEDDTKDEYEIKGCGQLTEFEMKGTHENEHRLLFPENYLQQDKISPAFVTLSYNLVNKNTFFKIPDEYSDIPKAIEKLEENKEFQWPCSRDEEHQIERKFAMNEKITTLYELSSHELDGLCCSLMLTIIPSCIFINSSGIRIKIINCVTNEECFLESNYVTIPFYIEDSFMISLYISDEWIKSSPIFLNDSTKKKHSNSYDIPTEGRTVINVHYGADTTQLLLTSKSKGKRRIVYISSILTISNYSSYELGVIPFCVDNNEKIDYWKKNEFPTRRYVKLHKNEKDTTHKIGNPVSIYSNIAKNKASRKHGTVFMSFIMVCNALEEGEFSCPIKIQQTLRKCINIHYEGQSQSICISILKHAEQYFVSIFNDSKPMLSIINNTDFNLYVAQTDVKHQSSKHILPHREIADDRFTWYQVVNSKQSVFYSPPIFNEFFPEIMSHDYGLIFACVCGDEIIRWSIPVKIDETKKIIINVPMFGDLKLLVDMKKITSEVSINYIDSDEVTSESSFENSQLMMFNDSITRKDFKTFSISRKRNQSIHLNLNMYVEGVNLMISKDDADKRLDLMSLSVDEILTNYSKSSRKLKVNFSKIQIDNELFLTGKFDFPVLLCNKEMPKTHTDKLNLPNVSTWDVYDIIQKHQTNEKFSIDIDFYESDKHVKNVLINLLPIRIYIEDGFIHTVLELADECVPHNFVFGKEKAIPKITLPDNLVLVPNMIVIQSMQLSEPIRLHSFKLEAVHVLLSVHTCKHLYIALDHSPLDFSAYEKLNIYTIPMKLGSNFGMHYVSSAIFGAGWVVGSLEILGSPSGLARSFTSGVKDFVSMPIQGIFKGPFGFFVGLTQGSVSLFRNVTTGTLNSVTKLANSVARNLDNLTMDNEHIYLKTDTLRRSRPQGFTDGLQLGLTGFGINILGAIGGLSRHPLQAKNVVDVFTGVGKGLIGVITKPISGIAELVAFMGSGVLQSVGYNILPNPLNQDIRHDFSVPNAEKIISTQLPQFAADPIVLTCRATYVDKNDLKYAFLILNTKSLTIVDLEKDSVLDVHMLVNISPISHKAQSSPDNLFVFKLKKKETAEADNIEKYHVSKRTVLYIKQLSNQHFAENRSFNEENEDDSDGMNEIENHMTNARNDGKISFYVDQTTGKYLQTYISLIKHQISSKENSFPLFEDVKS